MLKKTPALIVAAFLLPIVVVLAMHRDTIVEDMKPSPENGYLVYVTTDT
jgi:hypothetical protein